MASKSFDIPGFDVPQGQASALALATEQPEGVTLDELRFRYLAAGGPVWRVPFSEVDPRWFSTHPGESYQGPDGVTHEFPHGSEEGDRTRCPGGHRGKGTACQASAPNRGDGQTRWRYEGRILPAPWDQHPLEIERLAAANAARAARWIRDHDGDAAVTEALGWLPSGLLIDEEVTVATVRLIDNADELEAAEARLRATFAAGGERVSKSLGYQGGQAEDVPIYWHADLGIWGCIDDLPGEESNRFWNAFGTQDPRSSSGLSIVCEVNPARDGVTARVAGAFGRTSEDGHLVLLHRGRIGGGRAGVGRELFWRHTTLPTVANEDDPAERFVLVADLDAPKVAAQIAEFVREVERIKSLAGEANGEDEPSGRRSRYAPLTEWLRAQPEASVTTTFRHIESLVGELPPSARRYPIFWTGTAAASPTHTQKRAWEAAGFRVGAYDMDKETVTFVRTSPATAGPRYWWVNQGMTYDRELAGGYVWAPVQARNGRELAHHRAVSELQVGDVILHYQRGIRAVGRVIEPPVFAPKPDEITEDAWERDGRLCRVSYAILDQAIPLEAIPVAWRIEEGGPFNSSGAVNQAYLFPLTPAFVERLAGRFDELADALGIEPEMPARRAIESDPDDLDAIAAAIRDEGLRIDDRTLRRFHLAVRTRGFVILSGISGTGKTWLAEAYARAVGGDLQLVPVAPNWNTNEDLIGYLNPIDGAYHDTTFSRFVRAAAAEWIEATAQERPAQPYFLILDEMNLARVEYYFAQFLSALEVRARQGTGTLHLGYDEVALGGNLKIIGTVNIDETTHGFADKVYDRAQLIELAAPREAIADHLGEAPYASTLLEVWDALHGVAPFAFRVLDEMRSYVDASAELNVPWQDALDELLLQKVLPKLRGLDPTAGEALEAFLAIADEGRFPLSRAKASEMLARFGAHGSVSYFG